MQNTKAFDTVIVGARVAGASLALQLARKGQKVALLDRATFPSDTLSTHVIYPNTLARLEDLGVLDLVLTEKPPPLYTVWHYDGRALFAPHTPVNGRDYALCVRRITLDSILLEQARAEGVAVFEGVQVQGLLGEGTEQNPVHGVTATNAKGNLEFHANLVVGADGANSSVAHLVGSQKYDVIPTETMLYFAYWKGASSRNTQDFFFEPPWVMAHFPADNDHHVVSMNGPVSERKNIKNLEAFYYDKIASVPALWARLKKAEKVSKVRGTGRLDGFFRTAAGPGWVLSGDAAHFKHPATAQGIADALHAAEALAPMIINGSYRIDYPVWREAAAREMYAFSKHLAEPPTHSSMETVFNVLTHDPVGARLLFDVWARTSRPWKDVIPRVPGMEKTTGISIDSVLAAYQEPLRKIA